jgi:hypothetical protein
MSSGSTPQPRAVSWAAQVGPECYQVHMVELMEANVPKIL